MKRNYFSWASYAFLLCGISLMACKHLWMNLENGRAHLITAHCRDIDALDPQKNDLPQRILHEILSPNFDNMYFIKYIFCNIVTASVLLGVSYLFGIYLNYFIEPFHPAEPFKWHLTETLKRNDAMIKIFPQVIQVPFYMFGPSGSAVKQLITCVVPINRYLELLVPNLFFFMVFLFILQILNLCYICYAVHLFEKSYTNIHPNIQKLSTWSKSQKLVSLIVLKTVTPCYGQMF
jgi:hypothetical protein